MSKQNLIIAFDNEEIIKKYLANYINSWQSVKMRESSLNYFFKKEHFNYEGSISKISKSDLIDYFNYLKHLKLTITTKRNKWRIMMSFLAFCMEYYDDFVVKIPNKTISWGQCHEESKSNKNIVATKDEIKRILEYLKLYNYKKYLIFRMLIETGMRKGELVNIEYPNTNIELRYIKTRGKTGEKKYFFSRDFSKYLKIYLNERKATKTNNKCLFINNRLNPYSTREFSAFLKRKVLKSIGLTKNITCHTFRRTLNTLRYEMGCPDGDLEFLLGHRISVNRDFYVKLNDEQKVALFDKWFPY